jgi:Domain of unknown function (DUF397)
MRYEDAVAALAAATNWHKSSYSNGAQNGCVEVGTAPGLVGVQDSKLGEASPILAFSRRAWAAFLADLEAHER